MAEISKLKILNKLKKLEREAIKHQKVLVTVGYTANYAIYVHEAVGMVLKGKKRPKRGNKKGRGRYWDPQGRAQAKFLEQPARELSPELGRIVEEVYRKTQDMEKALLAAGLRLQRESMKLVPVDTGNLKNSAFTRVEYSVY